MGGFTTPELNGYIRINFKGKIRFLTMIVGFPTIQCLEPYVNLHTLWLEGNGIQKISGLEALVNLKQLYLPNN